jgi:hypothetical protein
MGPWEVERESEKERWAEKKRMRGQGDGGKIV